MYSHFFFAIFSNADFLFHRGYNFGPNEPALNPAVAFNTSVNVSVCDPTFLVLSLYFLLYIDKIVSWLDTSVAITVPPNIGRSKLILLSTGGQQANSSEFSYQGMSNERSIEMLFY